MQMMTGKQGEKQGLYLADDNEGRAQSGERMAQKFCALYIPLDVGIEFGRS